MMENLKSKLKHLNYATSIHVLIPLWVATYVLIIFQDYLFSVLRGSGFYWSEVTLFNSYWLLFIPLSFLLRKFVNTVKFPVKKTYLNIIVSFISIFGFCIFHIVFYTTFITVISNLLFTPSHPFLGTLISSVSSDFYLTFLFYSFLLFLFKYTRSNYNREILENDYWKTITVKLGKKQKKIAVNDVQYFFTDKPYTAMYVGEEKLLLPKSLKIMEKVLDPDQFLRVHRSLIINKSYITALVSRQNGDYDAVLANNKKLRLSRHYRKRWVHLIQYTS